MKVPSHYLDNSNDTSKYLPFRFLICMISAISNPFLYSYFNETFKDGLQRIYASLRPQIPERILNRISLRETRSNTNDKNIRKSFQKRMNSCQSIVPSTIHLDDQNLNNVRTIIDQTTNFLLSDKKSIPTSI